MGACMELQCFGRHHACIADACHPLYFRNAYNMDPQSYADADNQGSFTEQLLQLSDRDQQAMRPLDVSPEAPKEQRELLGRWGEQLVFSYLRSRVQPGHSVRWVNENSESGLPFDLMVVKHDSLAQTAGEVVVAYIEVKSTATQNRSWFEVSHREWLLAQQYGDKYQIYRVFGAGTADAKVKRVVNPYKQWCQRAVGVCLAL